MNENECRLSLRESCEYASFAERKATIKSRTTLTTAITWQALYFCAMNHALSPPDFL